MKSNPLPFLASGVIALAIIPAPAFAQSEQDALVRTMIDCSQITAIAERVACYDGTIADARAGLRQAEEREAQQVVTARESFGAETMPRERAPQVEAPLAQVSATITRSRMVQPGYYAISLDDGSEWRFTESVPSRYFPPRNGTQVTIERGAMGSFRMLVSGKAPVRVRRTL